MVRGRSASPPCSPSIKADESDGNVGQTHHSPTASSETHGSGHRGSVAGAGTHTPYDPSGKSRAVQTGKKFARATMAAAWGGEEVKSRGGAYDKGEGIVSASRDEVALLAITACR